MRTPSPIPKNPATLDGYSLPMESAVVVFRMHPPISSDDFPGPALRGLLGWALAAHPDVIAQDFLHHRFHPSSPELPTWRLWFSEPPMRKDATFATHLSCFGTQAAHDLRGILEAFARQRLTLQLPSGEVQLALLRSERHESHKVFIPPTKSSPIGSPPPRDIQLNCLAPILLRNGKLAVTASALTAEQFIQSIRIRYARLCGLRHDALPPLERMPRLDQRQLIDVRINLPLSRKRTPCQGVFGSLQFTNVTPDCLRWLSIGEIIGVGGSTSFGFGAYTLGH